MPEVIQYQDPEDVESQEESEHGQSHEESEHESASRSSGKHEGVDDEDEEEDPESLDFADLGVSRKEQVSVEKIFSDLISFEENLPKKGKRKTDDSVCTSNPKKPRRGKNLRASTLAESSDAMANLSKKDEEKLLKTDSTSLCRFTFSARAPYFL
ncbi:hypothetical protein R1sor_008552 [Riccia sorocarpa]|uniref:Uncharacterized protein n=1 Tax=Riccia sorocarpa TaxID=122646 RepID=A0ABD3HXW7_9MARC